MCVYCWTLLSVSTACNVQRVAPSCPSSARTPCSVRTASASIHAVQQLQPFDLVLFLSVTPPFHCCSFFSFIPPPFLLWRTFAYYRYRCPLPAVCLRSVHSLRSSLISLKRSHSGLANHSLNVRVAVCFRLVVPSVVVPSVVVKCYEYTVLKSDCCAHLPRQPACEQRTRKALSRRCCDDVRASDDVTHVC